MSGGGDPFAEFRAYIERSEERIKALESQVAVLTRDLEHEREIRKSLEKKLSDVDLVKRALSEVDTTLGDFKRQINSRFSTKYSGSAFEGLFRQMWMSRQQNPCKSGFVKITGTSYDTKMDALLPNIIDSKWKEDWISKDSETAEIRFDFLKKKVAINAYTIRSYNAGTDMSHLKSWALEGSDDGKSWTQIDARMNTNNLNGRLKTCVFICGTCEGWNIIRLRLTGLDHSNTNFIALSCVEFFGTYY